MTAPRAALLLLLLLPVASAAQASLEPIRALVDRVHEDPAHLDRARGMLEALIARGPTAEMLSLLSRIHFVDGDLRATRKEAKLAAYERGREAGRRAIEIAPDSDQAHLWFAVNSGRWAEANGVMRSLAMLPTIKREAELILKLNPLLPEGHSLAASIAAELPGLLGGDRAKAERHFLEGLRLAPDAAGIRVQLARFYLATGRRAEARQELQRALAERAPRSPAHWALRDRPYAEELLRTLSEPREVP